MSEKVNGCLACDEGSVGINTLAMTEIQAWHDAGHPQRKRGNYDPKNFGYSHPISRKVNGSEAMSSTNPTPNIDDEMVEILKDTFQTDLHKSCGLECQYKERFHNGINALSQLITDARVEAVQELKRRWNDDRKIMDYSPATYQFICDKYIKELKENKR